MQDLMTAIQTTGFPIAAWIFTFVYMQKQNGDHKEEVTALSSVIKELQVTVASLQQLLEDKL